MSMSFGSKLHFEPGSWAEALYDIYIGMIVGARHSIYIVSRNALRLCLGPLLNVWNGDPTNQVQPTNSSKGLEVVAVGYGRTGTYSLALALEELGYPTLHTQHLYENEEIFNMWSNDIFLPSIRNQTIDMGRPNLQLIAQHFKATADLPVALYFEQILAEFPDCKFILTTRESSEIWFRSWNTLTKSITQPAQLGGMVLASARQLTYYMRWLFAIVNQDERFLTATPLPEQDKTAAIASYENHNRRVRELVPSERLLEYSVVEGWQPLCDFLQIDSCPTTSFPKTNSIRAVQVQSISAFIFPLMITLFVLFYAVAKTFERVTGKTVLEWVSWQRRVLLLNLHRYLGGEQIIWSSQAARTTKQRYPRKNR